MHLTLKKEAPTPASYHFHQQQKCFDQFAGILNNERPHVLAAARPRLHTSPTRRSKYSDYGGPAQRRRHAVARSYLILQELQTATSSRVMLTACPISTVPLAIVRERLLLNSGSR